MKIWAVAFAILSALPATTAARQEGGGTVLSTPQVDPNLDRRLQVDNSPKPSAKYAFRVRQELNEMYGSTDTGKYGAQTRTTLRYNPGVVQNLCVYFHKFQVFKHTMGNWQLSHNYLEVKYTYDADMDWVYGQGIDTKLKIRRPKTPPGYFRLGDVAHAAGSTPDGALLVKAVGDGILEKPAGYEEVWNDKSPDGGKYADSSIWNPVAPNANYVCLGHVWTLKHEKPSTDLIRCVNKKYVEPLTDGADDPVWVDGTSADLKGSLWQVEESNDKTLSPGTFISKACAYCDPPVEQFYVFKKKCISHYGQFPYCMEETAPDGEEPTVQLSISNEKEFTVPYGKLTPCRIEEEDQTIYRLTNKGSRWEHYAVEIYADDPKKPTIVGYKHFEASRELGEPYCLGSVGFGSSKLSHDVFIEEIQANANLPYTDAEDLMGGEEKFGRKLTKVVDGDFVFMFPCNKTNEILEYKKKLQENAAEANKDGRTVNGVINGEAHLGKTAKFGDEKWTHPHYCRFLEEPGTDSKQMCEEVDECLYTPGDCLEYDSGPCASGECATSGDQSDYNGTIAITESRKTCQAWASTSPHKHTYTNLEGNYCRNTESDNATRAWCYTTDPKTRWEYCNIPTCKPNQGCQSGVCSEDKLCGVPPILFGLAKKTDLAAHLDRPKPYGVMQDGPGKYIVSQNGRHITLFGNTWKAFELQGYTVSKRSILEFDFKVDELAEGHALCLDEDLEADVEIKGANRCFRLDGTDTTWSEVWDIGKPPSGTMHHFKLKIGDIYDGPKKDNTSYLSVGTIIKYLALVQDNDANPKIGRSHFWNIQLYEEGKAGSMNQLGASVCTRRDDINAMYGGSKPPKFGEDSRTILRYKGKGNHNLCVHAEENYKFDYQLKNSVFQIPLAVDTITGSLWEKKFDFASIHNNFFNPFTKRYMGTKVPYAVLRPRAKIVNGHTYYPIGDVLLYDEQGSALAARTNSLYKPPETGPIKNWADAVAFCKAKGQALASYEDYCKNGQLSFDVVQGEDQWAPTSDHENAWVCVGNLHHPICKTHRDVAGGDPSWGVDSAKSKFEGNYILCNPHPDVKHQLLKGVEGQSVKQPTGATSQGCLPESSTCMYKPSAGSGFFCPGLIYTNGNTPPNQDDLSKIRCLSNQFSGHFRELQPFSTPYLYGTNNFRYEIQSISGSIDDGCTVSKGSPPYCVHDKAWKRTFPDSATYSIPWAKLAPCNVNQEDKSLYGMTNEGNGWEKNAVELYKNAAGKVLYKHVGVSKIRGQPYCLGDTVFGPNKVKRDLPSYYDKSELSGSEAKDELSGSEMKDISTFAPKSHGQDTDFVLLFPCEPKNSNSAKEMKLKYDILTKQTREFAADASRWDYLTRMNTPHLGNPTTLAAQTSSQKEWTSPHPCQCGWEPIVEGSGGCLQVDTCFYEDSICSENSFCQADGSSCECVDGYLSHNDGTKTFFTNSAEPDYCVPSNMADEQAVGPASFTMNVASDEGFEFYKTEMKRLDLQKPEAELMPVKKYEGETFKAIDDDCKQASFDIKDAGFNDGFNGWYDPLSCGVCNQYCRWVGNSGSGGDPAVKVSHGKSFWACQTNKETYRRYDTLGALFPFKKCGGKNALSDSKRSIFKKRFDGLLPGTKYQTSITPVDEKGNILKGDVQKTAVVTPCCCPDKHGNCKHEQIRGDTSGRPINLNVYQEEGQVMFSFQDNSMCENAFAFTRSEVGREFMDMKNGTLKHVFTPNYNYVGESPCEEKTIEPGTEAADNLFRSKLEVNQHYRYCVRAVADLYSADPSGNKDMTLHSSDEACLTHVVRWQASIRGTVTTPPEAGRIPIEDVAVSWELLNKNKTRVIDPVDPITRAKRSRADVTGPAGGFQIDFDELDRDLNRDHESPVRIKFSKTTRIGGQTIKHKFLCEDGEVDCTDDGTIVFLKHLVFEQPLAVYDATTIPIRGRVSILQSEGCPVIGARVCLDVMKGRFGDPIQVACVTTDSKGEYLLGATIGTIVTLRVSYKDHDIVAAPENVYDYMGGIKIDPNKRYERNDFIDRQMNQVVVEVAGGLCDKELGASTIKVQINGCSFWETKIEQTVVAMKHKLPAHLLDMRVVEVADLTTRSPHRRITEHFAAKSATKSIDLLQVRKKDQKVKEPTASETGERSVGEGDSVDNADKGAAVDEANKIKRVRFQFDGELQTKVNFATGGTGVGSCPQWGFFKEDHDKRLSADNSTITDSNDVTYSFHLVEAAKRFDVKVELFYELLPGVTCSKLSKHIAVRFVNKVGVDRDFKTWKIDDSLKNEMMKCSEDTGCKGQVKHHKETGLGAYVEGQFLAGRPNVHNRFQKDFIIEVLDKENQSLKKHKAYLVVTGDYVHGSRGDSIALPTYEPIMILRDPPGGLSTATYENIQTSLRVRSSEFEALAGIEGNLQGKLGAEQEAKMILGTPFSGVNKVAVKVEAFASLQGSLGGQKVLVHNVDEWTVQYTTAWSYKTSGDAILAGRASDVMVIPSLYIELFNTDQVAFDQKKCTVTKLAKKKFTVDQKRTALSFLSVHHVEKIQIPKTRQTLSDNKKEEANADASRKKELQKQIAVLEDALKGWSSTMDAYNKNTARVWDSSHKNMVAREWFSKWASEKEKDYGSTDPTNLEDHWAALTPEVLTKRAKKKDSLIYGTPRPTPHPTAAPCTRRDVHENVPCGRQLSADNKQVANANIVHFSGGGNTMEFSLNHEGVTQFTRQGPWASHSLSFSLGYKKEAEANLGGSVIGGERGMSISYDHTYVRNEARSSDYQTSVSFELGDEQRGDEFAVEVAVDETYGTFIFKTLGGVSSQPYENGTVKGEDLVLKVDQPTKPVMPDEPLLFTLTVENNGRLFAECGLGLDQTTNHKGLLLKVGGQPIETEFGFAAKSTFSKTLEVYRGKQGYLFEPTWIDLFATWDSYWKAEGQRVEIWNWEDQRGKKWIRFEEPCPAVEWVGKLGREKKAIVDKSSKPVELSIFNPRKKDGSLQALRQKAASRLKNVFVWYRKLGSVEWLKALVESGSSGAQQIDFANIDKPDWLEDDYGYQTVPWDIAKGLPLTDDGVYEVMVESTCKEVSGAPKEFNAILTESVVIVVDRVSPEMYGKPMPIRDVVIPGEEVAMVFTEPIDCGLPYQFEIEVRLSGLEDLFDRRNLKVFCHGQKLSFQFDPTRINYKLLVGREMSVKVDLVADLQGNQIEHPIEFKMIVADLNIKQMSTTFSFSFPAPSGTKCVTQKIDKVKIQGSIAKQLGLSHESRVQIEETYCKGNNTVARVKIGPSMSPHRQLRIEGFDKEEESETAIDLYYSLLETGTIQPKEGSRKLVSNLADSSSSPVEAAGEISLFTLGHLQLLPGAEDIERYSLDAPPTEEEEMIMAVAGGQDRDVFRQRGYLSRLIAKGQNETNMQISETEDEIHHLANETSNQIHGLVTNQEQFAANQEELNEKVDLLLAQILQDEKASLHLHDEEDFQAMQSFLQKVEMFTAFLGMTMIVGVVAFIAYIRK